MHVFKLFKEIMRDKIHVLIISQYFPPDISGGGTRAHNYAKCLIQQNYDVTIITAFPHLHNKIPKKYMKKIIVKEKMDGINLIRVFVPSLLHTSAKNRILLHFSYLLFSMFPIFSLKPDIIFSSEPNLFSIIPAYFYSKIRGGKVIRVVDDLWPEAIYERGYVKSIFLKKILDHLAKFSYEYPKYILPLTNDVKNLIQNSYNIKPEKIEVLGHGVDTNIFVFNKKINQDTFTLMYSGSLVESYDFDIILNAAQKLQDIKFIIRGKGLMLTYIQNKIKELNLKNVIINTDIVPSEQLSKILSQADVFLVPMKDEIALNSTLPTKILECQALGRPIICCSNGAPGRYVDDTKSGLTVHSENLEEFVEAILKLKNNLQLCDTLGDNGIQYVNNNLIFEKIGMRLNKIIQSINS